MYDYIIGQQSFQCVCVLCWGHLIYMSALDKMDGGIPLFGSRDHHMGFRQTCGGRVLTKQRTHNELTGASRN